MNDNQCKHGHFCKPQYKDKECPYDNVSASELADILKLEIRNSTKYVVEDAIDNPVVEKAIGFLNKERLNTRDHKAHARDMGYKNQKEYEKAGCEFFNSNQGELYFESRRKRFYRYDKKTNRLAVSSNGILHTFVLYSNKKFEAVKKQEKLYGIQG